MEIYNLSLATATVLTFNARFKMRYIAFPFGPLKGPGIGVGPSILFLCRRQICFFDALRDILSDPLSFLTAARTRGPSGVVSLYCVCTRHPCLRRRNSSTPTPRHGVSVVDVTNGCYRKPAEGGISHWKGEYVFVVASIFTERSPSHFQVLRPFDEIDVPLQQ